MGMKEVSMKDTQLDFIAEGATIRKLEREIEKIGYDKGYDKGYQDAISQGKCFTKEEAIAYLEGCGWVAEVTSHNCKSGIMKGHEELFDALKKLSALAPGALGNCFNMFSCTITDLLSRDDISISDIIYAARHLGEKDEVTEGANPEDLKIGDVCYFFKHHVEWNNCHSVKVIFVVTNMYSHHVKGLTTEGNWVEVDYDKIIPSSKHIEHLWDLEVFSNMNVNDLED